jgi:pimeloyl-ACP methyl ester carboxylesterase
MSNKLSIVLVHGFWGGAAHWAKVVVALSGRG